MSRTRRAPSWSRMLPTVEIDGLAEAARDGLRALGEVGRKLTHVFVIGDGGTLGRPDQHGRPGLGENETPVRTIAASIVAAVTVDTPAEECARLQRHYNLTQLPVVDGDRLIG